MVEDHIAQGERHVIGQEQLITRLRCRGYPTAEAESLLSAFQATLRQHREHRAVMRDSLYPNA
jgi:hypothetical protein